MIHLKVSETIRLKNELFANHSVIKNFSNAVSRLTL